jgi:hypothetical protein
MPAAAAEQNGSVYSFVSVKTMKAAANLVDTVLAQEAGAARTITKAVRTGGPGDSSTDHHGDLQSDHRTVSKCQDQIQNIILGMIFMT